MNWPTELLRAGAIGTLTLLPATAIVVAVGGGGVRGDVVTGESSGRGTLSGDTPISFMLAHSIIQRPDPLTTMPFYVYVVKLSADRTVIRFCFLLCLTHIKRVGSCYFRNGIQSGTIYVHISYVFSLFVKVS